MKIRTALIQTSLAVAFALALVVNTANAQQSAPPAPVKLTSVEGITEYQLANGLHVLLFPDQSKPTITVNITIKVGSRNENYGETGMAHLLEHLDFKGTPKHPNIPQELTAHGARPNGSTWNDRTNYFETFSATDENLKWALDLEADRLVNSYIAKKDLESEMTVVRNEFERGENDPTSILTERVYSTAFLWHNYGKSTIGAKADLENVPIERLQAFYHNYYQPDNAVLIVAGKIDEAKTLALVNQYFGSIPKPTRQIQATYTAEPTQDGERMVTLRRTGDVQVVIAAYHIAAGSHPDAVAMDVLANALTDAPSGRLYKALVETKKASAIYGSADGYKEPGLVTFTATVRAESSLDSAKKVLFSQLDAIATQPLSKEDIDRARTKELKNLELTFTNTERVGLLMSEFIAEGDWRLGYIYRDRLKAVTVEDVQKAAAKYLKPDNRTVGIFIPTASPDRSDVPATPDVAAIVKDYKGEAAVAEGEVFDPSPANIEARTTRGKAANGLQYAFLPKKTRGAVVVARLTLRFGDEKALLNKAALADITADMLDKGTQTKTRQQIQDEFDRLKAQVSFGGSQTQANVNIQTTRENLPAVLKLVAEVLKTPSFPEKEFNELIQANLAAIEEQRSEPQTKAVTAYQKHLAPYPKGDVRYVEDTDEQVADYKAATLADVKKFYTDFYGANNAQLTVVGDFDAPTLQKLTTELFGSWKSAAKFTRVPQVYHDVAADNQEILTPDKANSFFVAGLNLSIQDVDEDYASMVIGNYMLGGGFLNSRLAVRIRQKDGLSYGVGSQFNASALDKSGSFLTFAIYAPQNVVKLEAAFKEEIARMLKDGFTADELAAAKSGYLQSRQVNRAQDNLLAGTLNNDLYINRTLAFDEALEKKIQGLTVEQVNAAVRKYIDPTKITIVKAGDFKAAAPGGK